MRRRRRRRAQFAAEKNATAFLIDASTTMLEPAAVARPAGMDPAAEWRAVDLAIYLVQSVLRNKCGGGVV